MLRLHSAVFTELLTFLLLHAVTPVGVLVRAFQGVTPSFDSSDYQFSKRELLRSFSFVPALFPQERVTLSSPIAAATNKIPLR